MQPIPWTEQPTGALVDAGSLWPLKNNYRVLEEKQLLCLNSVADFHVSVTTNFFCIKITFTL